MKSMTNNVMRRLINVSIGASGLLVMSSIAHAQSVGLAGASAASGASDPPATQAPTKLDSVVVTAERRVQSAQHVAASISVLSGRSLQERNIHSVNDLQHATPSLEVEPAFGGGVPEFRIRGVGFIDYTANNPSPVGVTVDDVAYSLPVQTQGLFFDINRIEVLRGPQGTLYGRNTTGGTINVVTNRPTATPHAGFTVDYGSHNAVTTEGYVSGPINDKLLGRLSFATSNFGAWQYNRSTGQSLGNNDIAALRGQLQWKVTPDFTLSVNAHVGYDKSDEQGLQLFQPYTSTLTGVTIPADTSPYATGWSLRPQFAKMIGVAANTKPEKDNRNAGVSVTANWNLGVADLTSITAYSYLHRRELADWDATQYSDSDEFFDDNVREFSQEFRLASKSDQRLRWLTGIFYAHDALGEKFYSDFTDRLAFISRTSYQQQVNTYGIFGQVTYDIKPHLRAIFGLRQEYERRSLYDYESGYLTDAGFSPFSAAVGGASAAQSSSGTSGKIGLEYDLNEATMLYATISRGYKSGGFTAHNSSNAAAIDPFKPETLLSYEVGVKSDLTDNLRVNLSAFHYDYRNQQVLSAVFDSTSQSLVGTFVNAPRSRIDGFETDLQWHPLTGLEISQYLGFKRGTYRSHFVTYNTVASTASGTNVFSDYNGTQLSFPKLSYGGQIAYSYFTHGYKLRAETNYSYRDQYQQLLLLGPNYTVGSYWLVNASISVTPPSSRWTFSVWSNNVLNRQYYLTKNFFLPNTSVAAVGEPRTIGIRASYRY